MARDTVEQALIRLQKHTLKHGMAPATNVADEFEANAMVTFFSDV